VGHVRLTHTKRGRVAMVDISRKEDSSRTAVAEGKVILARETLSLIKKEKIKKGNVLATAQIAGIQAAKKTSEIIPLCHQIPLTNVSIDFQFLNDGIKCTCIASAYYGTGVEMEALVGVSTALLTIWDMVKSAEKNENGQYPKTRISGIKVKEKKKD
jgi:cyclic pyranopterin phosphate synthase